MAILLLVGMGAPLWLLFLIFFKDDFDAGGLVLFITVLLAIVVGPPVLYLIIETIPVVKEYINNELIPLLAAEPWSIFILLPFWDSVLGFELSEGFLLFGIIVTFILTFLFFLMMMFITISLEELAEKYKLFKWIKNVFHTIFAISMIYVVVIFVRMVFLIFKYIY